MTSIAEDIIEKAVALLGAEDLDDEAIETRMKALTNGDAMESRRLIDWIPEAFGLSMAAELAPRAILPRTFQARDKKGNWIDFDLGREPVYVSAAAIARRLRRDGPEDVFSNIAARSSVMSAVLSAHASGAPLDGAAIGGPALAGIPAEVYAPKKSFWSRLFGGSAS